MNIRTIDEQRLILKAEKKHAIEIIKALPTRLDIPLVSDCAEASRYLRAGVSENYGRWKKESVPHLIEIMDRLHPDDPCTHVSAMKSVQSAVTVSVAENGMILWIKYQLGSVFYLTANQKIGKIRASSAIDTMIDDSGMAHLVKPMSQRVKQKVADSASYKEFEGGIKLQISSYGSIGDSKSNTYHLIICDEWDEAGAELADQGDTAGIIEGRTMAARVYKILEISTPSRMETSRIYKSFIMGDQREYFVPCPHCEGMQTLILKSRETDYGLTFNRTKDPDSGAKILDIGSVRYICQHCGREFFEAQKMPMLQAGEWRPMGKPVNPRRHSYHIPGLISPFLPWERICQRFIDTRFGEDLLLFKDFTINYLGNPWARIEQRASWEDLRDRAEEYALGEVPPGALRLYGGVDVQGNRLELAVWGIGKGLEKWLVDYQVFFGDPADINDISWHNMRAYARRKYKINGREVALSRVAIDCGYDPRERRDKDWDAKAHTVFCFVSVNTDLFIAVRGASEVQAGLNIIAAKRISGNYSLTHRYDINGPVLKEMVMARIAETSGPQAMHFPKWKVEEGARRYVGDHIFQQFLSERYEERAKDGKMAWVAHGRNEVLDTYIYATACAYLESLETWPDELWDEYKAALAS